MATEQSPNNSSTGENPAILGANANLRPPSFSEQFGWSVGSGAALLDKGALTDHMGTDTKLTLTDEIQRSEHAWKLGGRIDVRQQGATDLTTVKHGEAMVTFSTPDRFSDYSIAVPTESGLVTYKLAYEDGQAVVISPDGTRVQATNEMPVKVGRSTDSAIVMEDPVVSREHFVVGIDAYGNPTLRCGASNGAILYENPPKTESEVAAEQAQLAEDALEDVMEAYGEQTGDDPVHENNYDTVPNAQRIDLLAGLNAASEHMDTGAVAPEAATEPDLSTTNIVGESSARAQQIISQTDQVLAGEGLSPHFISIEKMPIIDDSEKLPDEPTSEPEAEQEVTAEKTPEEIMREACETPQTLMEALASPDTPPELKRAVGELVRASRESKSAKDTVDAWENDVKPLIKKIGGQEAEVVEKSLRDVIDHVLENRNLLATVSQNLEAASRERSADPMADLLGKVIRSGNQMGSEISSSRFKEAVNGALGDQRTAAFRAVIAEEDISRIGKKLESRLYDAPAPEEITALYEANGSAIRNGLDGIKVMTQQIQTRTEGESPNWKARRNKIQDLFARVTAVQGSSVVADRTSAEAGLVNELELTVGIARRMMDMLNEVGMPSQKNISGFQEKLDTVTRAYDGLFKQLEDVILLARSVSVLAVETR